MKKMIISIILIMAIVVSTFYPVYADGIDLGTMLDQGKQFVQEGEQNQNGTINQAALNQTVASIYSILLGAGAVIMVVVGLVLGMKFMMAASADEKVKWNEAIKVYAIGIIVIFGAYGIWTMVISLLNRMQ